MHFAKDCKTGSNDKKFEQRENLIPSCSNDRGNSMHFADGNSTQLSHIIENCNAREAMSVDRTNKHCLNVLILLQKEVEYEKTILPYLTHEEAQSTSLGLDIKTNISLALVELMIRNQGH